MPSLQSLKNRIKSIRSTQKVTRAMQLISASRLHKAKEGLEKAIPYTDGIKHLVSNIVKNTTVFDDMHPMLKGEVSTNDKKDCLVIVVTSNKGLCGSFNNYVIQKAKRHCLELHRENKNIRLLCIGKKGFEALKGEQNVAEVFFIEQLKKVDLMAIGDVVEKIFDLFSANKFTECTSIYNKFVSIIKSEVVKQRIIPCDISEDSSCNYSFEPRLEVVQESIVQRYIESQVYRILLENAASEHSARMTAMDNATRNSKDMLRKFSHQYNRTRQALITKELIEIISGAEVCYDG